MLKGRICPAADSPHNYGTADYLGPRHCEGLSNDTQTSACQHFRGFRRGIISSFVQRAGNDLPGLQPVSFGTDAARAAAARL